MLVDPAGFQLLGPAAVGRGGGAGRPRPGRGRGVCVDRGAGWVHAAGSASPWPGVDDLMAEWDATAELARYHWDRRSAVAGRAEPWEVLADVERVMRSSVPLPHTATRTDDIGVLLELIEQAEDAYGRLLGEHLKHAERILAGTAAVGE